ncbi:MAG: hypothetical protein R3E02_12400 [Blastomonas sp.]
MILRRALPLLLLVLAGCADQSERKARARQDANEVYDIAARAFANPDADGRYPRLDPEAAKSGTGRAATTFYNSIIDDSNGFIDAADEAGMNRILDGEVTSPSDPVLRKCDDIAALEQLAVRTGKMYPRHFRAFRKALDREKDIDPDFREGVLSGFTGAQARNSDRFALQWRFSEEIVREVAGLCRLLAAGGWSFSNGSYLFDQPASVTRFNGFADRLTQISERAMAFQKEQQARTRRGLEAGRKKLETM